MHQLNSFHQTKTGLFVFGLVELGLMYGAASWAIDSGNLLLWFLAVVLLVGTGRNLIKLIGKFFHGKRQASKA